MGSLLNFIPPFIIITMINESENARPGDIVTWSDKYAVGIEMLDSQHRMLVELTNQLYSACNMGGKVLSAAFQDAMHKIVEYVRFHFSAELKLLNSVNYPDYNHHKKMHDDLIHEILNAAKEYNEGKMLTPYNFVRTLKDWIFSHIAVYDKEYSIYIAHQKKTGVLTDKMIKEIELSI